MTGCGTRTRHRCACRPRQPFRRTLQRIQVALSTRLERPELVQFYTQHAQTPPSPAQPRLRTQTCIVVKVLTKLLGSRQRPESAATQEERDPYRLHQIHSLRDSERDAPRESARVEGAGRRREKGSAKASQSDLSARLQACSRSWLALTLSLAESRPRRARGKNTQGRGGGAGATVAGAGWTHPSPDPPWRRVRALSNLRAREKVPPLALVPGCLGQTLFCRCSNRSTRM